MSDTVPVQPTPIKRPHWSPSQVSAYYSCGEAYRRRYIEKEVAPPTLAMIRGTVMHRVAEFNFRQKVKSFTDITIKDAVEFAVSSFEAEIIGGLSLSDDEQAAGLSATVEVARQDAMNLAAGHMVHQAPRYQPLAVEQRVRIPIVRGTHDLVGVLDLVTTGHQVRDFKTGRRRKKATDAAESAQLTMYAAAHEIHFGKPAVDVGLDVLIMSAKGVGSQQLVDKRDAKDLTVLSARINAMDAGVKAGVFLPTALGSWQCSKKWCPYFSTCPYVNAERIAAAAAKESSGE